MHDSCASVRISRPAALPGGSGVPGEPGTAVCPGAVPRAVALTVLALRPELFRIVLDTHGGTAGPAQVPGGAGGG